MVLMAAKPSGPQRVYGPASQYEGKLRRVMERLDVKWFDWNHDRHEAWIEFVYRGEKYRFSYGVAQARESGQKLHFGSDCFAQLVLGLEDLARLVNRGIYELGTWIVGMKALPAGPSLAGCLVRMGFTEVPTCEQVEARWKSLVKSLHPDAGGNDADFIALQAAYQQALAFVGSPEGGEAR